MSLTTGNGMLVSLHICGTYYGQVKDDEATSEFASLVLQHKGEEIDETQLKMLKRIIPTKDAKQITAKVQAIRNVHNKYALPWDREYELLPSIKHRDYVTEMGKAKDALRQAHNDLCDKLNILFDEQKGRLRYLLKDEERPNVEAIRNRLNIINTFSPIPDPDTDFRVSHLSDREIAKLKAEREQLSKVKETRAVNEAANRLHKAIGKLLTTLKNPSGRIGPKTIANIKHEIEQVEQLNTIFNSDTIADLIKIVAPFLVVDADLLRSEREDEKTLEKRVKGTEKAIEDMVGVMANF